MAPEEILRERLASVLQILFATLYGSRAGGTPGADSDWDVAVFLDPTLSASERLRLRCRLTAELEDLGKVDVVVLNDASPLLAHRALMGERLVVRDPTALVRFQVHALARSDDERHWREVHWQARQARLSEGTFGRS